MQFYVAFWATEKCECVCVFFKMKLNMNIVRND